MSKQRLQPLENPGDDWGCANCGALDDGTWPIGSDICNTCFDAEENEP